MPGAMPYLMEKGPVLAFLESAMSEGTREQRFDLMEKLRDEPAVSITDAFNSVYASWSPQAGESSPAANPYENHFLNLWFSHVPGTDIANHIETDWVGGGSATRRNTGWWSNFKAEPGVDKPLDGLIREAYVRAFALSLGVSTEATSLTGTTRNWRVELWWTCGTPRFEGWVSWRSWSGADRDGLVTLTWLTPSFADSALYEDLAENPPAGLDTGYRRLKGGDSQDNHAYWNDDYGQIGVGLRHTSLVCRDGDGNEIECGSAGTPPLNPPPIIETIESSGELVVVHPSFRAGGVYREDPLLTFPYPSVLSGGG